MGQKKLLSKAAIPLGLFLLSIVGIGVFVAVQPPCDVAWPIPPPVMEFDNFHLITDQGPLYLGQTYEHRNEGPWMGNFTLVFIDSRGATLLLRVPHGTGNEFKVTMCRTFLPRVSK